MGKAKYLLAAMHAEYFLKLFQLFLKNRVFIDVIQHIPVDGLWIGWRQQMASGTI